MDVGGHIPGLPGLFLAGLVSSALATMSACLNTLSGMVYDDFIDEWLPESPNRDSRAANIMKVKSITHDKLSKFKVSIKTKTLLSNLIPLS